MKKFWFVFMISFMFLGISFCVVPFSFAQPEEEEEPIQARPNPVKNIIQRRSLGGKSRSQDVRSGVMAEEQMKRMMKMKESNAGMLSGQKALGKASGQVAGEELVADDSEHGKVMDDGEHGDGKVMDDGEHGKVMDDGEHGDGKVMDDGEQASGKAASEAASAAAKGLSVYGDKAKSAGKPTCIIKPK